MSVTLTPRQISTRLRLLPEAVLEHCFYDSEEPCPRCGVDCDIQGYGTVYVPSRRGLGRQVTCPKCDGTGLVVVTKPDPEMIAWAWQNRHEPLDTLLAALAPTAAEIVEAAKESGIDAVTKTDTRLIACVDKSTTILAELRNGVWHLLVDCDRPARLRTPALSARIRSAVYKLSDLFHSWAITRPRSHQFKPDGNCDHCVGCARRMGECCEFCHQCPDCCDRNRSTLWWE